MHGLQTGWLAIKRAHRTLLGPERLRLLGILFDPAWTEPLPILAWVIEHPEGLIVVDSGEVAAAAHPHEYLACDPATAWFVRNNFRLWIEPADELGAQLAGLGLDPNDARWLVQTHLHFDHVGGAGFFPQARVVVSARELSTPPSGAVPCRWPASYHPEPIEYRPGRFGPFEASWPLTKAGDVRLVPTPGHTAGHQSVVLYDGQTRFLFAGDAVFDEGRLLSGEVAGIVQDVAETRITLRRLLAFCREGPTILLPTHDSGALRRLATSHTVPA